MRPVEKALWFVESHFAEDIALADIAERTGVSRHHLTRAFGEATGWSVMRYVRVRRLTEAARALADGATDILTVALEAGYGSHEAFTRAFGEQFGVAPEIVRARRHLDNIPLVEPIRMDETLMENLEAPRFENADVLLIAGLSERYTRASSAAIPAQWQRFAPHLGNIPRQIAETTYGVCHNGDDDGHFDYVCGVQVADYADLSTELSRVRISAHRYAVFAHREHVSTVRRTMNTIWNKWLPESGHQPADAPFFERYDASFDPRTGMGGFEIWIPIST